VLPSENVLATVAVLDVRLNAPSLTRRAALLLRRNILARCGAWHTDRAVAVRRVPTRLHRRAANTDDHRRRGRRGRPARGARPPRGRVAPPPPPAATPDAAAAGRRRQGPRVGHPAARRPAAAGWRFRNGATARPTAVRAGLSTARMRRMRAPPHRKEEMTGDGSSPKSPRQLDGGCHIDPSLAPHHAAGSGVAGGTTVRPCLHGACTACIDTCYPMGPRRSDHIPITRIPWPLGQGSRLGSRDARSVHLHSGVGGGLRGADVSPTKCLF